MLSQLREATKWFFLLTLPLTFLPLFNGTLGGILFPIFHNRHITSTTEKYLHDVKDAVSDWGVGGDVPSFRQFQDQKNGFHLTRLNSNDWVQKLGFLLPIEYSDINFIMESDIPIDKQASLTTLMAPKTKLPPREQWVLLTRLEWLDWEGWNAAYDNLLRHAYSSTRLNSTTSFHFAECSSTASFLCNVWNTRSPALIHFLIEEDSLSDAENLDLNLSYTLPYSGLLPVTVRIIELGLQEAYTFLPWTTFPSKDLQLLALVASDRKLYEQFEPIDPYSMDLLFARFNEYMDQLYSNTRKGSRILHQFGEMEWWWDRNVIQPLGLDDFITFVHVTSFQVSMVFFSLLDKLLLKPIQYLFDEFLGTPKPGDVMFAGMEGEEDLLTENSKEDLGDMFGFGAIFKQMSAEVEKASSAAARTAEGGSAAIPETTREGRATKL